MERERLLFTSAAVLFSAAVWLVALPMTRLWTRDRKATQVAWWRLVLPLFGGLLVLAFLCGWALQEPDPTDEWANIPLYLLAAVTASIVIRALVRSGTALRRATDERGAIYTVGLLRPRIVVSDDFRRSVSPSAFAAALAHEGAHVRRRDPLRIWLAQLVADLQWPAPGTSRRFSAWLLALESERDDEALAAGVAGEDLAEAILVAARLHKRLGTGACAHVDGAGAGFAWRVRRLLTVQRATQRSRPVPFWAATTCCTAFTAAAVWLGIQYGEIVLRALPGVGP